MGQAMVFPYEYAVKFIQKYEGFSEKAYLCTSGFNTIGYGYNLDSNPLDLSRGVIEDLKSNGITKNYAVLLFNRLIGKINNDIDGIDGIHPMSAIRYAVLIDMGYNLGFGGLLKFRKMLDALRNKDYKLAAREMLDSKWATQVKGRAIELARVMETGRIDGD